MHFSRPYPSYKKSDVPWLSEIPVLWCTIRGKWLFSKVTRPIRESDEVITCFRDGMVTLRKNRRLSGFTEALQEIGYQGIRTGDLVIHAMDAFAGAVGVSDSCGKGSPVYSVCNPISDVEPKYYAQLIREMARNKWILALSKGIRERSTDFRFDTFGSQLLPVPPLAEQQAIVKYLDYIDKRIKKYIRAKQKQIKLLEEQNQAIINQAVTRGLDPYVPLKHSDVQWLGVIPEQWKINRLVDLAKIIVSNVNKLTEIDEKTVRLCNYTDVYKNDRINADMDFMIASATEIEIQRFHLENNDVIITKDSEMWTDIGVPALIVSTADDLICGYHLAILRPRIGKVDGEFLFYALKSQGATYQFSVSANGITRYGLSYTSIKNLSISYPSLDEQKIISKYIRTETDILFKRIEKSKNQIQIIKEYQTRLIADVVTGKLDVREAAAQLPDGFEDLLDEPEEILEEDLESGENLEEAIPEEE